MSVVNEQFMHLDLLVVQDLKIELQWNFKFTTTTPELVYGIWKQNKHLCKATTSYLLKTKD